MIVQLHVKIKPGQTREHLAVLKQTIEAGVQPVVKQHADMVRDNTRTAMAEGKSGVHYPRLPRRSSAVGEAMATQSGKAANALKISPDGRMIYRIWSPTWYFNFNETKRNRPTLSTGLRRTEPHFLQAIRALIERL